MFLKNVSQHVFDLGCCARTVRSPEHMPKVFSTMATFAEDNLLRSDSTIPFSFPDGWREDTVLTFEEMQKRRALAGNPDVTAIMPSDVVFMHDHTQLYNPRLKLHGTVTKVLAFAPLARSTCRHAHPTTF